MVSERPICPSHQARSETVFEDLVFRLDIVLLFPSARATTEAPLASRKLILATMELLLPPPSRRRRRRSVGEVEGLAAASAPGCFGSIDVAVFSASSTDVISGVLSPAASSSLLVLSRKRTQCMNASRREAAAVAPKPYTITLRKYSPFL